MNEAEQCRDKDPRRTIVAVQHPKIGEAGTTGTWRTFKPVLDASRCILLKSDKAKCHFCWMYCPEVAINRETPPVVNLTYCKGCGICAHECPHGAITMKEEHEE